MDKEFINALKAQNNLSGCAQLAHWAADGINSYSFHLLFGRIYETASAKLDVLAEQARGNNVEITAEIFTGVPDIEWSTCEELTKEIYGMVEEYQKALEKLHAKADDQSKFGVLNVVEDLMSDVNSMLFLLGSVDKKFS